MATLTPPPPPTLADLTQRRQTVTTTINGEVSFTPVVANAQFNAEMIFRSEAVLAELAEEGFIPFTKSAVFYDPASNKWQTEPKTEYTMELNISDKMKVFTTTCLQENRNVNCNGESVSKQNIKRKISPDGEYTIRANKNFVQNVDVNTYPPASGTRYKSRHDDFSIYPFSELNVNIINMNMAKGGAKDRWSAILLLRGCEISELAKTGSRLKINLYSLIQTNTAVTMCSVVDSVRNSVTFKNGGSVFRTTKKKNWTRRVVAPIGQRTTFRRNDSHETNVKYAEFQIHSGSLNGSAIAGFNLIEAQRNVAIKMLNDPDIIVDCALASAKTALANQCRTLIPRTYNDTVEILCWAAGTRFMNVEQQLKFFRDRIKPEIETMWMCRDNFAAFEQYAPKQYNAIADRPVKEQISKKYKNPITECLLLEEYNPTYRPSDQVSDEYFMEPVRHLRRTVETKRLSDSSSNSTKKKIIIPSGRARSVGAIWGKSSKWFKRSWPLKIPLATQL